MSEYTVKTINNCKVIFGSVPVGDLDAFVKISPKGSIIDTQASRHLGATLVIGLKEDTETLMDLPACYAVNVEQRKAKDTGLSEAAQQWLSNGERGTSSNTIFAVLSGMDITKTRSHPHDPADLRRCRLLLEQVPEFAPRMGEMASISKEWAGLVASWDMLCGIMDGECDWRKGQGYAPKTYKMMQECIYWKE